MPDEFPKQPVCSNRGDPSPLASPPLLERRALSRQTAGLTRCGRVSSLETHSAHVPTSSRSPVSPGSRVGGRGAREQAPRTTAPRHVHLTLPHLKLRPLLAWHCVWREARHLSPAPPPPRGPRGPCGGGVGLRELPRTPPPQVCRPDVLLAYPVFLDHEKTNCGRICRVASVCASWGDCV